jgi:hypothetical protein
MELTDAYFNMRKGFYEESKSLSEKPEKEKKENETK